MSQCGYLLFLCLMLIFNVSRAQEVCGDVDYKSQVGPVRDQGETGWCFAYTAADLLTQKLRKSDPQKFAGAQVSALDMTFQYLQNQSQATAISRSDSAYWKQKFKAREAHKAKEREMDISRNPTLEKFQGGFVDMAIHTYHDHSLGVCTEKDLPSEKGMTKEIISAVNQQFEAEKKNNIECNKSNVNDLKIFAQIRNKVWSYVIERKCNRIVSGVEKKVRTVDNFVYDQQINPDGSLKFFTPVDSGQRMDVTEEARMQLKIHLDEGLNHGSIVGIGIMPSFLMNDQVRARMLQEHARHEVSVVARKKIEGQCMYQIRNSWGASCDNYNKLFKSRCTPPGYIWVSETELLPYMTRAHYLE